jgi:hypothetical protein
MRRRRNAAVHETATITGDEVRSALMAVGGFLATLRASLIVFEDQVQSGNEVIAPPKERGLLAVSRLGGVTGARFRPASERPSPLSRAPLVKTYSTMDGRSADGWVPRGDGAVIDQRLKLRKRQ